mgnify:CR=1 FL=1
MVPPTTSPIAEVAAIPEGSTNACPVIAGDPKDPVNKKLCAISLSEFAEVPTGVIADCNSIPETATVTSVNASSYQS